MRREKLSTAELAKVKKQAKAQFIFAQDGVYRTALALGAFAAVDGVEAFPTLLERIDRVTAADVSAAAARYFAARMWAPRYWPKLVVAAAIEALSRVMDHHVIRRRRRNDF